MTESAVSSSLPDSIDVLVVGFGPVGAALAALLGRYGVAVLVIDKATEILQMPRAIALDNEALRILQMAGLQEDAFEKLVIPEVRMHCPYVGEFGRANTRGSIDGHPKLVTFFQPDMERALRDKVASWPSVQVCTGWELTALSRQPDAVIATVCEAGGASRTVRARYLIGADGASSRVRSMIGQQFQGQSYGEEWLIVDARNRQGRAIDHVEFLCDPRRPTPHMPAPGGRERWEFMLRAGETAEAMEQPERVSALVSRWVPAGELDIERCAVYRFHARCCNRFSVGRVFLAGDAAHVTPPFAGQGLVAGLRDAANLAWKLAWVIRRQADEALLQSYDRERRAHARKMIDLARIMGMLIMPRSRWRAMLTHAVMRMMNWLPPLRRQMEELKIKPANRVREGCLVRGAGCRGKWLPQGMVRSAAGVGWSDALLDDALTLVGFGVDPAGLLDAECLDAWQRHGGRILQVGERGQQAVSQTPFVEDLSEALIRAMPPGWVAVIRPDRVVMHEGPAGDCIRIVRESLAVLAK